ncbi:MAG: response regulator transcription factor [Flavobacteriales bacterium]
MSDKKRLLLVEDDPSFGTVLRDYLALNDYDVIHALDGEEGLERYKKNTFDICVLDVMMPKKDGFSLAKDIKKISDTPIIFLTAKSLKEDVLKGYQAGADDYVLKPFDSEVLLYKISAVLQRKGSSNIEEKDYSQEEFIIGSFEFNSKLRFLKLNGKQHKLSPKENELLKLLCLYQDDLMPRELALTRIWHDDNYFTSRSMDVYIAKLRKYLKPDTSVEIENIHGEGFRLTILE